MTLAKMCVYLAGPMTGYPHMNRSRFTAVAKLLRQQEWACGHGADKDSQVFSPGELVVNTERAALRRELCWIIDHATHVALIEGHEASKGGAIEKALARKFDLPVAPYWAYLTDGQRQWEEAEHWHKWYVAHRDIEQEFFSRADESVAYWLGG
jgi:hypothetical protein